MRMAFAVFVPLLAYSQGPTAREVIERIKQQSGVEWSATTVDTFKAGNPETRVTGIATTFGATMDMLQRAAKEGKNLIIAHEPTFYSHLDQTERLRDDPVFAAKQAFIEKNGLVVFRFHDHWHRMQPDGMLSAIARTMSWGSTGRDAFAIPETTLDALAAEIRKRYAIRTMRVVGDPRMKLTKVGLAPGASGSANHLRMLRRDDVEVLVIGEAPEWETVEYVRDAVTQGKRKALILMGHVPSEEGGMRICADWLQTFIKDIPVGFVPAGQPFWAPE